MKKCVFKIQFLQFLAYGYGFLWNTTYLTINKGEFVRWTWSAPFASSAVYKIEQLDSPASTTPSGFSSGLPTSSGSFIHQFTSLGTYYYWSGFVDANGQVALRGVIVVQDGVDVDLPINVFVDGILG